MTKTGSDIKGLMAATFVKHLLIYSVFMKMYSKVLVEVGLFCSICRGGKCMLW